MKLKHMSRYALTLTSAALLCGTVTAQERTERVGQQPTVQHPLKAGDVQASNLIGAAVKSTTGNTLGEVTDLIVTSGHDVRLAVIAVGGVLGVGEKKVALPYEQFSVAPDGKTVYVTMTEDELKAKPAFDADGDDNDAHAANRAVDRRAVDRDGDAPAVAARPAPEPNASVSARNDGAQRATADARSAADSHPARTLKASEQPASSLIGAPVVDAKDAKVGKINDLIVTSDKGTQAVLALGGGVGGLGARLVTVPLDKLTIKRDADKDRRREPDRVQTGLTVAQLDALPEFRYE